MGRELLTSLYVTWTENVQPCSKANGLSHVEGECSNTRLGNKALTYNVTLNLSLGF